ncbi:MAG: menaquinone biosynthesis decarboxylase [Armatimonadetes bacterium]|nr:menaquinone biosynthesis decarboxylase [Armatimonadota bacterium]
MAYRDLSEFVELLRQKGQIKVIAEPVDPYLEMTEIADRVVKKGGPALLFTDVKGHTWPVLMNMYGSAERMAWALEADSLDAIAEEIAGLLEPKIPVSFMDKLKLLPKLKMLSELTPRVVKDGICQEVVETETASLDKIPIITCWPQDGGPYITLPLVFTKHPRLGTRNVGMYRLQKFDARTLGMHWQRHKGGAQHYRVAEEMGQRLEVAVALSAEPSLIYAATAPLPEEIDEMMLAAFVRDRHVDLVKCKTVDLEVPANAHIILEGYVEPHERRLEGPFGDHTGYYSLADEYPVFHLTAITHKRDPIYATTIVGPPPMEDGFLGKATERVFLPLIRKTLPEIVDMNLPVEGIFHNLAIISIDKRYPGHARKVMHAVWGLGQLMFTKVVIIVDKDCNVQDMREVIWKVGTHLDPKRDCMISEGPTDVLDHSAMYTDWGGKLGIDATRKWPEEGYTRTWPDVLKMSSDVKERIDAMWGKLGL